MNVNNFIKKYGMLILTLIIVISTIYLSVMENNRAQEEFNIRMRPYLILSKEQMNNGTYLLKIKNEGLVPAKIISRNTILYKIINSNGSQIEGVLLDQDPQKNYSLIVGPGEETSLKESIPVIYESMRIMVNSSVTYQSTVPSIKGTWKSAITHPHHPGSSLTRKVSIMEMS